MMNELIKITVKNDNQLVSARDLHKNLGLTTRFSKWFGQNRLSNGRVNILIYALGELINC